MNIRPIDNFYKQFSHAHAQNLTNLTTSNILNPIFWYHISQQEISVDSKRNTITNNNDFESLTLAAADKKIQNTSKFTMTSSDSSLIKAKKKTVEFIKNNSPTFRWSLISWHGKIMFGDADRR